MTERPQKRKEAGGGWARERFDLAAGLGCAMFADEGENAEGKADTSCSHGICFSISNTS